MSKSNLPINTKTNENDLDKSEFQKSAEEKELLKKLKSEWKKQHPKK